VRNRGLATTRRYCYNHTIVVVGSSLIRLSSSALAAAITAIWHINTNSYLNKKSCFIQGQLLATILVCVVSELQFVFIFFHFTCDRLCTSRLSSFDKQTWWVGRYRWTRLRFGRVSTSTDVRWATDQSITSSPTKHYELFANSTKKHADVDPG